MSNERDVDIEPQSRKRPTLVWVISVFYMLITGFTIISFLLVFGGAIPLTDAQKASFDSLHVFDFLLSLALASLHVVGTLFLFLLRRLAYHCFLAAFCIGLINAIFQNSFQNWLGGFAASELVGTVIAWLIGIAIIFYSKNLIKKGILK
jgi:putative exporter of polyketide antibiotics